MSFVFTTLGISIIGILSHFMVEPLEDLTGLDYIPSFIINVLSLLAILSLIVFYTNI